MSERIAAVIDGPKTNDGKTPFTMFWVQNGWRRAQCFNTVLEDRDVVIFGTEKEAKDWVGWEQAESRSR